MFFFFNIEKKQKVSYRFNNHTLSIFVKFLPSRCRYTEFCDISKQTKRMFVRKKNYLKNYT